MCGARVAGLMLGLEGDIEALCVGQGTASVQA